MRRFFSTFAGNLKACFLGKMLLGHLLAIGITFWLVSSGFDWRYFCATRNPGLLSWMFPAAPIGALVPLALPLVLFLTGILGRKPMLNMLGWAIGQAELLGSMISSLYKAVTGRVHPAYEMGPDISHEFRFGFLRGGVFWGWPSSHTTIAFAMAFVVFTLLPNRRWRGLACIGYALYIGLGVSVTIHWFSDFVAGMILGTMIGIVVGTRFTKPGPP